MLRFQHWVHSLSYRKPRMNYSKHFPRQDLELGWKNQWSKMNSNWKLKNLSKLSISTLKQYFSRFVCYFESIIRICVSKRVLQNFINQGRLRWVGRVGNVPKGTSAYPHFTNNKKFLQFRSPFLKQLPTPLYQQYSVLRLAQKLS